MSILIELLNILVAAVLIAGVAFFAFMSSVMVSEKKARYKAGTHDYYDNPIEKRCLGGEDEAVEKYTARSRTTETTPTATGVFDKSKVAYRDGDNT